MKAEDKKIVITDASVRFDGGKEKELPVDSIIRFEFDGCDYRVSIANDNFLLINKVSNTGQSEQIAAYSGSANQFRIK